MSVIFFPIDCSLTSAAVAKVFRKVEVERMKLDRRRDTLAGGRGGVMDIVEEGVWEGRDMMVRVWCVVVVCVCDAEWIKEGVLDCNKR